MQMHAGWAPQKDPRGFNSTEAKLETWCGITWGPMGTLQRLHSYPKWFTFPLPFFFLPLLEFFFSSHAQLILLYKKLSGRQSSLSGNAWEAI